MEMDLLNADSTQEEHLHKLKRLVQTPNSFFMDVICGKCNNIETIFSHSQTVVCAPCGAPMCTTTGGRCKLVVGCSWRRKGDWVWFAIALMLSWNACIEERHWRQRQRSEADDFPESDGKFSSHGWTTASRKRRRALRTSSTLHGLGVSHDKGDHLPNNLGCQKQRCSEEAGIILRVVARMGSRIDWRHVGVSPTHKAPCFSPLTTRFFPKLVTKEPVFSLFYFLFILSLYIISLLKHAQFPPLWTRYHRKTALKNWCAYQLIYI